MHIASFANESALYTITQYCRAQRTNTLRKISHVTLFRHDATHETSFRYQPLTIADTFFITRKSFPSVMLKSSILKGVVPRAFHATTRHRRHKLSFNVFNLKRQMSRNPLFSLPFQFRTPYRQIGERNGIKYLSTNFYFIVFILRVGVLFIFHFHQKFHNFHYFAVRNRLKPVTER